MSVFRHLDSPARVGSLYLRGNLDEADPRRLEAFLLERLAGATAPRALTADALHEASSFGRIIGQAVHADFCNGDTVNVEGWILSRTEARLCGLFALTLDCG